MKEKISIHNYELYFIDYAEGNLSLTEMREVDHFINMHQELKEEFEAIISFPIHESKEKIVAPASLKNHIKKKETEIIPSRFHSLDEMMAAEMEEDLDAEEKRIFYLIICDNPDKLEEFELLKKCRLTTDEKIKFSSLSTLKIERINGMPSRFRNFNEFAISGTEGELPPDELKALEKMISYAPSLKKEFAILNACKIKADLSIHYPDKSSLKQKAPVITFNRKTWLPLTSVAAAALILLFLLINVPKEVNTPVFVASYSPTRATVSTLQPERDDHRSVYLSSANSTKTLMNKGVTATQTKSDDIIDKNDYPNISEAKAQDNQNTTNILPADKSSKEKMLSTNYVIEKAESPDKAYSDGVDNSINIDRYVVAQFRKKVLKEDPSEYRNKKLSGWDLADAGLQRVGQWLNKDWQLHKEYDENGKIRQVAFNSQRISIDSPVKQK